MSGQLCFTSRYGPFSERLDDEVTFQTSAENQGSDLQGVDNLAFESDQLIGDQNFSTSDTTRNSATFAFQSHVNKDRSGSSEESFSSQESIPEIVPLGQPWRALGWFFSRTIVSIIILFLMTGASLALAGVSVFVVGPTPYFDKSLNAFQIPNHVSTRRQMAFDQAKKDDFKNLPKRSADNQIGDGDYLKYWDSNDGNDIFNSLLRKTNSEISGIPQANSNSYYAKQKTDLFINDNEDQPNNAARPKRGLDEGETSHTRQRRSAHRYRSMRWRIQLVYIAEGDDKNIFTKERLETIHNIEMSIMNHPNFTFFCSRNPRSFGDAALAPYNHCIPPNSLMTYFYPSEVDSKIIYDGVGTELADINGTLAHAMTETTFYWYVDTSMNTKNRRSKFLRSEVWFGGPIGEIPNTLSRDEVSQLYKDFVITYIDLLNNASTDKVRVLYGGTQLFDYEVSQTISHDLSLAIPTGVAIFLLLFILTSFSVWLTIWGFASILLSFAWAYFIYHVAFGKAALGLLNLVSAFVIIGIGVDDVFVFVNTFLQADHYKDPIQRMAHTIKTAGIATFFTSFTTAGAFAANIASQIPAINDFGLFMCLIVSFCWLLVVLIMPCALTLWHRCFHCEAFIFGRCVRGKNDPAAAMANLSRVLARHERQATQQLASEEGGDEQSSQEGGREEGSGLRATRGDDNDIPLLDLEELNNTQNLLIEDDEPLILTNDDEVLSSFPSASTPTKQTRGITKTLQSILYNCVATPVIKGRWIVVLGYLVIFGVSLGLVVQINPANRPPALYNPDTNLQQLLDLAYNFSGSDIACRSCSGFSSNGAPSPHGNGPVTLPVVIPVPTRRPPSSAPQHGGVITTTTKVTPRPPADTLSPDISNPPGVSFGLTTELGQVITAALTVGIRLTCAEVGPTCEFGSTCDEGDATSEPVCRCIFHCTTDSYPVCGSNGQTYINLCDLRASGCINKQIIHQAHSGACDNSPSPDSGHPDTHGQTTRPSSQGGASYPQGGDTSQGGGEEHANSPHSGFNPCAGGSCGKPAVRPALDNLALVYVVFGIDHIDMSEVSTEHVVAEEEGQVVYDNDFNILSEDTLRALCKICKNVAARTELVEEGGAQCFPDAFSSYVNAIKIKYEECRDLPVPNLLAGTRSKSLVYKSGSRVVWFAMAFQSKTFMGQSSFESYKDYNKWEEVMKDEVDGLTEEEKVGLKTMFQTSSYWKQIFMEIVGVTSAIYGVAFSLLVCVVAVVIFTAHIGILLIAFLTIGGVILVVISMFYLLGWEMGAVEAVSLSILVGSSVDYCIHLIEGYLVAGDRVPDSSKKTAAEMRNWRIRHSVSTIGVSILSSAITTIIASIPLCFTTIQIFAKFGKIVAMNTFVSIFYTLTACTAFLSIAGPARYQWNLKWFVFSALVLCALIGAVVAALFVLHTSGVSIPGPSGSPLF
ncbi:protein dispatched homolog 3-like isoform X2 [Asterias rubens]|nr:protein dispatched homolog 3-like isoform X2 [Asterias rubens]XP_033641920.1 protein dispatched homolog 3-like isoform X2 [Asterias rubens]